MAATTDSEQTSNDKPEDTKSKKHKKRHPTPLRDFLVMVVLYLSRRIMFLHTNLVLFLYVTLLFVLPLVSDTPRTHLAKSDNAFNEYFVKIAWWWTMVLVLPLTLLTSFVTCCGHWSRVLKHLARLCLATSAWYIWTSIFELIETNIGECVFSRSKNETKQECLDKGYYWRGFDISMDTFTLIYTSLIIIEETRVLIGWEVINELIIDEDDNRLYSEASLVKTRPLKDLTTDDFTRLKVSYSELSSFIQWLFLAATCLTLLLTVMLINTLLYFSIMIEKVVAGVLAILTWYFTYRLVCPLPGSVPLMPGEGLFIHQNSRK